MDKSVIFRAVTVAGGRFAPGHLGELTQQVPFEMVDAVLEETCRLQRRVRDLPARVTVYLLLAGCLFAELGYSRVWGRLTAGMEELALAVPSASALTQARRRLGPGPLRALFHLLRGPSPAGARWRGLLVVAIDGTIMSVAGSAANLAACCKQRGGRNGDSGYPQLRVLALVSCGTRTVIDAVFRPVSVGETTCTPLLLPSLRAGMVLLADRNFAAGFLARKITETKADFLIRVRTGNSAPKLPVLRRLPDGSWLSLFGGVSVRVIDASWTVTTAAGQFTSDCRLVTTLADPARFPACDLAVLYHERWEIEMVFTQLAKRAVWSVGGGREDVADLDLVIGDDHAVDEELGELTPLLEAGGGEAGPDGLAECLDPGSDSLQFQLLPGGGVQLALLGEQGGVPAVQVLAFALELGQGDDLGEVGVQQPLLLALELAQGLAGGRLPGLEFLGQPGPALGAGQRAGDVGGVGQQRAQVSPDQVIQLPGGDVTGGAAPPFGRAQRVGAPAAQVVAVTGAELAAGARQPARAAADQRAQQVLMAGVARRALLVGIQFGLDLGEDIL